MMLFDVDVCVEILRGNQKIVDQLERSGQMAAVSFMTVGELYFGAFKSARPEHNLRQVDMFILGTRVIDTDNMIMMKFGQLKSELSKAGRPLPDADVLIAATTLVRCSKLITGNEAHFARFCGLSVENWLR